ncbi:MAG: endonuclease/exonuclease/phosphatase family protein [Roseovarius sp.]
MCCGLPVQADTLRIATYHTELTRDGPGLLVRDIAKGKDAQLLAMRQVVAEVAPDILLLQGVDYDHGLAGLTALQGWLAEGGVFYPHVFAAAPNSGLPTGYDMDADGRLGEPEDAHGYGSFFGQSGMALLSKHPIDTDAIRDFSPALWVDVPDPLLPVHADGTPFPSAQAQAALRLATVGQWMVPVRVDKTTVSVLAFHAGPPVFDGPEDRNGKRNHDELVFWQHYLDGVFGPAPKARFVLLGAANLDPVDGEGYHQAITGLLNDPRLQDPAPRRPNGELADSPGQSGDPEFDTVAWPVPDPGHRRADYVLPSADWQVVDAGVYWPKPQDPKADVVAEASRHRMVWVDLMLP